MENFDLGYSIWYVLLCLLTGLGYAFILYFKERQFSEQPTILRLFLAFLRAAAVTFLALLLLSPVIKLITTDQRQPIIVIGQDLSQSVTLSDVGFDSTALREEIHRLRQEFGDQFEVRLLGFGEGVRQVDTLSFQDRTSDIAQFLEYVQTHYGDQNLGAVILGTDGLYNKGKNPVYAISNLTAPVYPLALGDTTEKTDQSIRNVYHNQIAYLGDKIPIQVDVSARRLQGSSSTLHIEQAGTGGYSPEQRVIRIDSDPYFQTFDFLLDADKPGVVQYKISLRGISGEANYANNSKLISIEVIDGRENILVLANSPHPDLGAIKATIESHKNYSVELAIADEFGGDLKEYDLVILHQIPGRNARGQQIFNFISANKIPHMYILGEQSLLPEFSKMQGLVSIQGVQRSANNVQGSLNPNFDLFKLEEGLTGEIEKYVPLQAPYGNYSLSPSANVLFYQQIGKVATEFPLFLFGEDQGSRVAILCGEGFWRWRLFNYLQDGNHETSQRIFQSAIQYLSIKEDKRNFRVQSGKSLYLENEEVTFSAELYNASFELVNQPEVFLKIIDAEGSDFDFIFNRRGEAYFLNIGKFPVGQYRFLAHTDYNSQRLTAEGRFTIQAIQLEAFETTADHRILHALARETGGTVFYPSGIQSLAGMIKENETIKPVIYQSVQSRSVIHLRWIGLLLAFLLCLEWFLRRYFGGY